MTHQDDRLRRERSTDPSQLVGYITENGQTRAFTGDDAAPRVHVFGDMPEVDLERPYLPLAASGASVFELTSSYQLGGVIDVRDWRCIALLLRYTARDANGRLSIIPEVNGSGPDEDPDNSDWVHIAVLDSTITQIDPAGALANVFGRRTLYASEFATVAAGSAPASILVALPFEVTPYKQMRVSFADVASGTFAGFIRVSYVLAR